MIRVIVDLSAASQQEIEVFFGLPNVASAFDTLSHPDEPAMIQLDFRAPSPIETLGYDAQQ